MRARAKREPPAAGQTPFAALSPDRPAVTENRVFQAAGKPCVLVTGITTLTLYTPQKDLISLASTDGVSPLCHTCDSNLIITTHLFFYPVKIKEAPTTFPVTSGTGHKQTVLSRLERTF